MNLKDIFGKFAGREIPLVEKPYEVKLTNRTIKGTQLELADENHPTLAEMNDTAAMNGLTLRLWWPGVMGTMDMRDDRVNAHLEKSNDGKWRVANKFNIG